MATFLKNIDNRRIVNTVDESTVYTVAYDSELTFSYIASSNDPSFKTDGINSVWSLLNMYSSKIFDSVNVDWSEGGLINTFIEPILNAYDSYGLIMFEASESNWRKMIDGGNFLINVPLDATYTGGTSGLTATTLYSSFIDDDSVKVQSTNSLCDGWKIDGAWEEPSISWTDSYGIGYQTNLSDNLHRSGVVYLMSNDTAALSGTTGTSKDWSEGFNVNNKFTYGRANFITPTGPNRDISAGIFFVNSGKGLIWDIDFVQGFDFSGSTGGTGTTGVYFTGNKAYLNAADVDSQTAAQFDLILRREDFNTSLNDSYREDSLLNGTNCDVAFNTITLNDSAGNCLVVAKASEAITKPVDDFRVIYLTIPIDGNIEPSLADTRGCTIGNCG
jgi:hypothetical protein